MLGKLIKQEWKATWKYLILANGGILLFSIIGRIGQYLIPDQNSSLSVLGNIAATVYMSAYIFSLIGVFFITHILLIVRYYKNFYTDEGYLMHTLPVSPASKLFSKFIVNFTWYIVNLFCTVIALIILLFPFGEAEIAFTAFGKSLDFVSEILNAPIWLIIIFFLILGVVSIIHSIMKYYFCISVGANFSHKIIGAILTYGVLYVISQIASVIFLVASSIGFTEAPGPNHFWILMIFQLMLTLILAVLYTLTTHYMLSKKINLN